MEVKKLSDFTCPVPRWISHPEDPDVIFQRDKPKEPDMEYHASQLMDAMRVYQTLMTDFNIAVWFLKAIFEETDGRTPEQLKSIAKEALIAVGARAWTTDQNGRLIKTGVQ